MTGIDVFYYNAFGQPRVISYNDRPITTFATNFLKEYATCFVYTVSLASSLCIATTAIESIKFSKIDYTDQFLIRDCPQTISLSDSKAIFEEISVGFEATICQRLIGAERPGGISRKGPEDDRLRVCGQSLSIATGAILAYLVRDIYKKIKELK